MKLNLGCGKDYIDDWVNVDFYDDSKCDESTGELNKTFSCVDEFYDDTIELSNCNN